MSVEITASDLRAAGLEDYFTALDEAVAAYENGGHPNVAVVSEPFGGREALIDYVTDAVPEADHVSFPSSATTANLPDVGQHDVIVLSDCHALFTRRIGGFDVLDAFLESIAASETFVVTAWNQYAWSYLDAVRDVADSFDTVLPDPNLDAEGVAGLLSARYEADLPAFVETGEGGRVKSVAFDTVDVPLFAGRTVGVPVPQLNLEYLLSWTPGGDDVDVETVVFRKVALLSNGNPGVAVVLFDSGITDGQIAPAYVEELDRDPELDPEESFVLWAILANDDRSHEDLAALFDGIAVDRTLHRLGDQGMVAATDDSVAVVPEALHAAVEHLRRRRLLW